MSAMSAILKAILQLWFLQPVVIITALLLAVFPQFILVVGQFPTVPTTKCVISVVESFYHYDVTVKVELCPSRCPIYVYGAEPVLDGNVNMEHAANVADQAPPGGSPQQDGVALEEYSGRNDPTVERRGRRNKFSGNLLLEGEMVTGEYDEDLIDDSDQGAVDGEEKWRGDRSLSQYGTTVETGETSRPQVGKRKRSKALVYNRKHGVLTACGSKKMRAGVVIVDKFDVED
ncbi:hypothetical protein HID58_024781, partial [Brassica napus]